MEAMPSGVGREGTGRGGGAPRQSEKKEPMAKRLTQMVACAG